MLTLELPPDKEQELRQAAEWEGIDVETFLRQAAEERLQKRSLSFRTDAQLLAFINEGFPAAFWSRFRTLAVRRDAKMLARAERDELISLSDRVEARDAERLYALTELAQRRSISVRALMAELGIRPAPML